MTQPAPRRVRTHAVWSAPARLPNPIATRGHPDRRGARARTPVTARDRKLPILAINFVLFLLYVAGLVVLSSDRESAVRIMVPLALGALGIATFAPLALAVARRGRPSERRRGS